MKTIKLKKIFLTVGFFSVITFLAFGVAQASATSLWDSQIGANGANSMGSWFGQNSGTPEDIRLTIYKIINFILNLLGILFLILTIIAGFIWMTSAGDSKKVETAIGYLKGAIIGLVIILVSKGLTIFIFEQLLKVTFNRLTP